MEKRRKAKETRELENRMRAELLSGTYSSKSGETAIAMDYFASEQQSLLNFDRNIDNMLDSGGNILNSLRNQRTMLKGVHKRIVDIGNNLGMSNTVMRLIEKRTFVDKLILYGGMSLFCLFMFLCWYFFL
ncbi:Golgi SNAP receptor complex member 2-like protein [Dinothrombium tinctorium]|uniref:Golgi SNAP receptor complex member 2-like protein n=1 Tax=Dinothrombium tinctorium TaxID=1965070 RepID=A0A3S3PWK3_9ACAR|nr:Golgi SNAP receptor complex member 2-like protein [Dinothrombium tinctorium]